MPGVYFLHQRRTGFPYERVQSAPPLSHPPQPSDSYCRPLASPSLPPGRPAPPKTLISLRVDTDVLAWFKAQGAGYQTRMNAVLRAFKEAPG